MDPALFQSWSFLTIGAGVVVIAALAARVYFVGRNWERTNKDIGSILEFKYLHPLEIRPEGKYPFLLFISALQTGEPTPDQRPDIIEVTIQRQIERILQDNSRYYREHNALSTRPVQKKKYLTYEFKANGLQFDPKDTTRLHNDELVIQPFEVIADKSLDGKTVRGVLVAKVGWFTVAELGFEIRVTSKAACEPFRIDSRPIRRDIFPSYAREDAAYLEEFEKVIKVFGDEYMSDVKKIRAGTVWSEEIKSLIDKADLFQLFWSRNAAESDYIPIEIDYARSLNRSGFIYPTICEEDSPPPPASVSDIQTVHVSLERKKQKVRNKRRAYAFAPLLSFSGASADASVPALAMASSVLAVSVALGSVADAVINRGPVVNIDVPPVDSPTPPSTPTPTPTPTPPPDVPALPGQVLGANNEGVANVLVMLCPEPRSSSSECSSINTDRGGSFSFATVDKARKYSVTVSSKDLICQPRRQSLTNFDVPQQVRFVCRKTEAPSPSPTPTFSPTPVPGRNVQWDATLDRQPQKEGESAIVTVRIRNVGTRPARNIRVKLQFPSFVAMSASRLPAQQSRNETGNLFLQFLNLSLAAGKEQQWEIKIVLTRDLKSNERVWIEKYPIEYDDR